MTKKDYIKIADVLREIRPYSVLDGAYANGLVRQWEFTVLAFANSFSESSCSFNRERFLDYVNGKAGPSGGKVKK